MISLFKGPSIATHTHRHTFFITLAFVCTECSGSRRLVIAGKAQVCLTT